MPLKISRADIIDAALELLNEVGLDQLSTRRLAEKLNLQQPSLYARFKNKRALLDEMNEAIVARHHQQRFQKPGESWRDYIAENARSFRRAMRQYRDSARVHAGVAGTETSFMWAAARLSALLNAGFSEETAVRGMLAIWRFNVGSLLEEQAREGRMADGEFVVVSAKAFPLAETAVKLEREIGYDAQFEAGLEMILDGMEAARLREATAPKKAPRARRTKKT